MVQLVLTDDQRKLFEQADGDVSLIDAHGRLVAIAAPVFTPAEAAEAIRHQQTDNRRSTTQEVLQRIRAQEPE